MNSRVTSQKEGGVLGDTFIDKELGVLCGWREPATGIKPAMGFDTNIGCILGLTNINGNRTYSNQTYK